MEVDETIQAIRGDPNTQNLTEEQIVSLLKELIRLGLVTVQVNEVSSSSGGNTHDNRGDCITISKNQPVQEGTVTSTEIEVIVIEDD